MSRRDSRGRAGDLAGADSERACPGGVGPALSRGRGCEGPGPAFFDRAAPGAGDVGVDLRERRGARPQQGRVLGSEAVDGEVVVEEEEAKAGFSWKEDR